MKTRIAIANFKKLTQLGWVLWFFLLFGCANKESKITCGCDGGVKKTLSDDIGIMVNVNDGGFKAFHFLSLNYGYFDFCNDVPLQLQIDGLMIKISGDINNPCVVSKD